MTELITNSDDKRHLDLIQSLWAKADEVFVVVAYLKNSGLNNLIDTIRASQRKGTNQKMLCSLDFGISDPAALSTLRKLLDDHPKSGLFLSHDQRTFHPKIYCFRIGSNFHLISGSANFTNGGLCENVEASLYIIVSQEDKLAKQTLAYLNRLFSSEFSEPASELKISQYISFQQEQELNRKKHQKRKPASPKSIYKIDYPTLQTLYREYLKETDVPSYNQQREKSYAKAREILKYLAENKLRKAEFRQHYEALVGGTEVERLWYSGSLFRHKAKVIDHYQEFQELVKFVLEHQRQSPFQVFEEGLQFKEHIPGVGVNILTEVMMTLQPEKFANLNKNPLTVLLNLGCNVKKTAASYTSQDYQSYCDLIAEIRKELKLKNNLEVDSFFNDKYWKLQGYN